MSSRRYASGDYQGLLGVHGTVCSMSRRGSCWDNAVAESFFATLKVELVHAASWATRAAARAATFDYLEISRRRAEPDEPEISPSGKPEPYTR